MDGCTLCRPDLGPIIAESDHWRLVLNHNQNLVGKCFLALRRHLEPVPLMTSFEWQELHQEIRRATEMLVRAFQPDHFNYAFLQNQDRHIHLHVIPRYASQRTFVDIVFNDLDYPDHYSVGQSPRRLTETQYTAITEHLQQFVVEPTNR
jgi:diadenosine tetraphosphate (Ap4A) HIT family hydrolase